MLKIGIGIKRLRIEKCLSQKQLAKAAQITPSFLSLLENDRREPSFSVIERLAMALDVPDVVLIWDAAVLPEDLSVEDRRVCDMAKFLVRRYRGTRSDAPIGKDASNSERGGHSKSAC